MWQRHHRRRFLQRPLTQQHRLRLVGRRRRRVEHEVNLPGQLAKATHIHPPAKSHLLSLCCFSIFQTWKPKKKKGVENFCFGGAGSRELLIQPMSPTPVCRSYLLICPLFLANYGQSIEIAEIKCQSLCEYSEKVYSQKEPRNNAGL